MPVNSNQVKELARSLGFDACGIARVERLVEAEAELKRWVDKGLHGQMKYMEDFDQRAQKFWESFPEAKSIIVVGVNYYSRGASGTTNTAGNTVPARTAPKGRVARYAWGKDYHHVIGKRLEEFRNRLSQIAGREIRAEICVDTKPLLERSIAEKAGLGFIGKQSQLLSPQFGPWLFLAELVTDIELEPDQPYIGTCGSCTICIDECPTDAIHPEGGIDARRCISYLTIEHKGEIAETLRPLIGDWVFGCDICLQVCPHASKSKETRWPELRPDAGPGETLDLLKILQIPSNRAYEKTFQGTALLRARRKQMVRNAKIVLGNAYAEAYQD